ARKVGSIMASDHCFGAASSTRPSRARSAASKAASSASMSNPSLMLPSPHLERDHLAALGAFAKADQPRGLRRHHLDVARPLDLAVALDARPEILDLGFDLGIAPRA